MQSCIRANTRLRQQGTQSAMETKLSIKQSLRHLASRNQKKYPVTAFVQNFRNVRVYRKSGLTGEFVMMQCILERCSVLTDREKLRGVRAFHKLRISRLAGDAIGRFCARKETNKSAVATS